MASLPAPLREFCQQPFRFGASRLPPGAANACLPMKTGLPNDFGIHFLSNCATPKYHLHFKVERALRRWLEKFGDIS
jgi:hypothetical protein